jgi:S1-C subfamily serine protease
MKRVLVLLPVLALAIAVPAFAGGEKCTAATQECLDHMADAYANRGWIGVEFDQNQHESMIINTVVAGSPAEKAGFQTGDTFFAVNGVEYAEENHEALKAQQEKMIPGAEFTFTVKRGGKSKDLAVVLGPMPDEVVQRIVGAHMLDHAHAELAENE